MRIAVGIPSFREAANIAHVVTQADRGLAKVASTADCLLVNVDSGSDDGTVEAFLATPTATPKRSFTLSAERRGKGRNLLRFFELCVAEDFDVAVTLDADVTSVTPDWIRTLIEPLVHRGADYVAPAYRRHKFDGSTTNMFAFPLVYAWTGKVVRQPIGGDFALTLLVVRHLLDRPRCESVLAYGIDIFMTLNGTLFEPRRVEQVNLGRKLHTASFDHFETVAREVIAGAAVALEGRASPAAEVEPLLLTHSIDRGGAYGISELARECFQRRRAEVYERRGTFQRWLPRSCEALFRAIEPYTAQLTAALWADAVAEAFLGEARGALGPEALADLLVPLLVIRTVAFWDCAAELDESAVEAEVLLGARLMRDAFVRASNPPAPRGANPR